jgi:hypothetical protein
MTFHELVALVAGERSRVVEVAGSRPKAELGGEVRKRAAIPLTDFMNDSRREPAVHRYHIGHVLGAPASPESIKSWHQRWHGYTFPSDLTALLARCNGIHLNADLKTGRAYHGLAPIEEWRPARFVMYGDGAEPSLLDDRYLALTYHQDGAAFVVLDSTSGSYYLMDAAGPDTSCPIGTRVVELLEWLWTHRLEH